MARIFTADYSTGDFSGWTTVQTKDTDGEAGSAYKNHTYPLTMVGLGDCGFAARHEVRNGDVPDGQPTGARSEVGEESLTHAHPIPGMRWYTWSMKFDPSFPANHSSLGWASLAQFQGSQIAVPTMKFGFETYAPTTAGYFHMCYAPQSAPFSYLGLNTKPLAIPMNVGNWIDMKVQIQYSSSDTVGFYKVWVNGVPQTFSNGTTTLKGRTCIPGDTYAHMHLGYYRKNPMTPTGIVYFRGFRIADTEASL